MSTFKPRDWGSHAPFIAPGYKSTILRGPSRPALAIKSGLTEGTGPRFAPASVRELDFDLTKNGVFLIPMAARSPTFLLKSGRRMRQVDMFTRSISTKRPLIRTFAGRVVA